MECGSSSKNVSIYRAKNAKMRGGEQGGEYTIAKGFGSK
jgi:hypothetical protein